MKRKGSFISSVYYAARGLVSVWRSEANFRLEIVAGLAVLIVSYFVRLRGEEWLLLLLAIGWILFAEVINSVAEVLSDAIHPKLGDYVKIIKDMAAGGVLLAAGLSGLVIVGLLLQACQRLASGG